MSEASIARNSSARFLPIRRRFPATMAIRCLSAFLQARDRSSGDAVARRRSRTARSSPRSNARRLRACACSREQVSLRTAASRPRANPSIRPRTSAPEAKLASSRHAMPSSAPPKRRKVIETGVSTCSTRIEYGFPRRGRTSNSRPAPVVDEVASADRGEALGHHLG